MSEFSDAYKALNTEQKKAVDALEGPVMVIAGPGTGKTQVLALRIANILQRTDTPAHGILCLTFTRAGVAAMRERLASLIGPRAREVQIATFHRFAMELVETHYALLDFDAPPLLLDEERAVSLIDELLRERQWRYIRPRGDAAKYFSDLRSLVSLMKRERLSAQAFSDAITGSIAALRQSPDSRSTRGESKGQLKKEVQKEIEGLERTLEVVAFYEAYESLKRERLLMDYDDVLEYAVALAESSEDVRAQLRENHLYVLVDEHQDSSGVQNAFLKAVWQDTESPNIFVVGDDRQLIYGFGGASLSYFEEFRTAFGKAALITLKENYRSTAPILLLADALLKSALAEGGLSSNRAGENKVRLLEYNYARDEIIAAGLHFRSAIASGARPQDCALLVPKNRHVRSAIVQLREMGLPVRAGGSVSLFAMREASALRRVLRIIVDPMNPKLVAESLLDGGSAVAPLAAHAFLRSHNMKTLSVETLLSSGVTGGLFSEEGDIRAWGERLSAWIMLHQEVGLVPLLHEVGEKFLIDQAKDHDALMRAIEAVRTLLHLAASRVEQYPHETLTDFLTYLDRLETYGHAIPVATLLGGAGISVLTLHGAKGLEYEHVWIAHMNESVLMSQKRLGFTLPQSIEEKIESRDRAVATREVYVAITRAKEDCTISYAALSESGAELELAHLIADIPGVHFEKRSAEETEAEIVAQDPKLYVARVQEKGDEDMRAKLAELVAGEYAERKVSVTLLNNFFECPWKWYFRNLLQLPEHKSEHQLFGSAVHGAIELILKGELAPKDAAVRETILLYLEKEGIAEQGTLKSLVQSGVDAVLRWSAQYYPRVATDHSAERSLSLKDPSLPHLTMYGKIDLTERFPDGTITVTDFKTGSSKTVGAIEKRDDEGRLSSHLRQLAMYSYLLEGVEKGITVATSRLMYLEEDPKEKNALYQTHITSEEIDLLRRDIADYDELVKSGEWVNRPCNFKPYGKETECEYCKWAREVYKR